MEVNKDDVKPYLSILMAKSDDEIVDISTIVDVLKGIISLSIEISRWSETEFHSVDDDTESATFYFQ